MTESRRCHDGVTIASQLPPWATAGDIKRDGTATRAHSCASTCVSHILQHPHIYAMDLSGMLLTDDNVRKLVLLCELRLQTIHTQTLLVKYRAHLQKKKDEATKRQRRKRSLWLRPWIARRTQYGQWEHLLQELITEDKTSFINFLRVDEDLFSEILGRISHRIQKQRTFWRVPLEPGLRLAITLRYLATRDNYKTLAYGFRVAPNTISLVVYETCEAIIAEYLEEVLDCPTTPEGWKAVAQGFADRWNFHHTVGAIDGKHIAMRPPGKSGSYYYNYKGFHSLVLMALVDSDYKFLYVDVGANGATSDAGVFMNTPLRAALEDTRIGLPPREPLPGGDRPIPYFIVGDEAFALKDYLQKPFPHRGLSRQERIYNYRLSRARRVVENAFGILSNRLVCAPVLPHRPSRYDY